MKKSIIFSILLLCVLSFNRTEAQIIDKIKNKATQKKGQKENEVVNKIFKEEEDAAKKNDKNKTTSESDTMKVKGNKEMADPGKTDKKEMELWSVRYDFLPGKKVFFYDDFENEEIGEIPSKWKFIGGGMETVQTSDNAKVMKWWDKETRPNFKSDFVLPDQFTLEFDIFLEGPPRTGYGYKINFYREGYAPIQNSIYIDYGSMQIMGVTGAEHVPDKQKKDFYNTWHHISVSYNKGSIKGYFDQYRLFNARLKLDEGERTDYIGFYNCCTSKTNGHIFLIDNVRLAEGAHLKYKEEILETGKLITNNIHFAFNSSQILPYSYGEIKRIADMMNENADLNFYVEGHTDSDGNDEYNLKLSKERADAVKKALTQMGVTESRLSTKGMGETKPLAENTTPEGKAMNRRVEFVKRAE